MLVEVKLVPLTVRVRLPEPALMLGGVMEVTVGDGVLLVVLPLPELVPELLPDPVLLPELEPELELMLLPPHPAMASRRLSERAKNATRRRGDWGTQGDPADGNKTFLLSCFLT
jgi:hypothetical protein